MKHEELQDIIQVSIPKYINKKIIKLSESVNLSFNSFIIAVICDYIDLNFSVNESEDVKKYISEKMKNNDRWVNIGIEYPPHDKLVLVTDGDNYNVTVLRIKKDQIFWHCLCNNSPTLKITHWMLLPELPK